MIGPWQFWVTGTPATKGSIQPFKHPRSGRVLMVPEDKNLKAWAAKVAWEAKAAGVPYASAGAVRLSLEFFFPRPKSHFKKSGELVFNAPERHTKKPDADKLVRAIGDALQGVIFADDAQVFLGGVDKWYSARGGTGVKVTISHEAESYRS